MAAGPDARHGRRGDPDAPVVDLDDVFADDELDRPTADRADGAASAHTSVPRTHAGRPSCVGARSSTGETNCGPAADRRRRRPARRSCGRRSAARPTGVRRRSLRATLAIGAAIAALLVGLRDRRLAQRPAGRRAVGGRRGAVDGPGRVGGVRAARSMPRSTRRGWRFAGRALPRRAQLRCLRASVELGRCTRSTAEAEMRQQVDRAVGRRRPAVRPTERRPTGFRGSAARRRRGRRLGVLVAAPPAPTGADPVAPAPAVADATVGVVAGSALVVSPSAAAAPVERAAADAVRIRWLVGHRAPRHRHPEAPVASSIGGCRAGRSPGGRRAAGDAGESVRRRAGRSGAEPSVEPPASGRTATPPRPTRCPRFRKRPRPTRSPPYRPRPRRTSTSSPASATGAVAARAARPRDRPTNRTRQRPAPQTGGGADPDVRHRFDRRHVRAGDGTLTVSRVRRPRPAGPGACRPLAYDERVARARF